MLRIRLFYITIVAALFCLLCVFRLWKLYHPVIDSEVLQELLKKRFYTEPPVSIFGDYSDNHREKIHIFMIINKPPAFVQTVILIKSLLYYQGRVAQQRSECSLKTGRYSGIKYLPRSSNTHEKHPVVLHFMADRKSRSRITEIFRDWSLTDTVVYLYPLESYWQFFSQLPVRHYAGTSALYKLVVPYLLPDSVEKVMVFDVDMLINEDIYELWKHFYDFKNDQVIGAVCEQIENCPSSCPVNNDIPEYGINSGMLLMNLTRMRQKNWWSLWTKGARNVVDRMGFMDNADQATINDILHNHPELYHSLPCAWNVQVFKTSGVDCCPVFWTDRAPGESGVLADVELKPNINTQMALAVHFNVKYKPVYAAARKESARDSFQPGQKLSAYQLRHRFHQVFTKFRDLPTDCII